MKLVNCLHPRKVTHYGRTHYVPCGQCDYCRYVRSLAISQRITLEMQHHAYGAFCTLSYSDVFLPKMLWIRETSTIAVPCPEYKHGSMFFGSLESGFCLEYNRRVDTDSVVDGTTKTVYMDKLDDRSLLYLDKKMEHDGYIPYLSKYDAQCFIKRVRAKIDYLFKKLLKYGKVSKEEKESFQVTYAICGEYGPTTLRPHFHCILLFDRPEIAREIMSYIREAWPYGRVTSRWTDKADKGEYVAQYVAAIHRLPKVYQRKEIRPFLLFSKRQPIGLCAVSKEEYERTFRTRSSSVRVWDARAQKERELPLWPSLERRLFPKFVGYSCLTHWQRVGLLRIALSSVWQVDTSQPLNYDRISFRQFVDFVHGCYLAYPDSLVSCYVKSFGLHSSVSDPNFPLKYSRLDSALYSLYSAASFIDRGMKRFGLSLDAYVRHIEQRDLDLENKALCNMVQLQSDMSRYGDYFDYIDLDVVPVDVVLDTPFMRPTLERLESFINKSSKNRVKREYLALHPERDLLGASSGYSDGFIEYVPDGVIV